jgi:4-carboxymuconolactone decarboxylase
MIRFPPIADGELTEAQRQAKAEIIAGPRRKFAAAFIPILRAPAFLQVYQRVGSYLRYESPLPDGLREFVTLLVVRHWEAVSEWLIHAPLAMRAGISSAVIRDIAHRRRPQDADNRLLATHDLIVELLEQHFASDSVFNAAQTFLDEESLVNVVGLCGYYIQFALFVNINASAVARTTSEFSVPD